MKLVLIVLSIILLSSCEKEESKLRMTKKEALKVPSVVERLNASGIPAFEVMSLAQDVKWAHKKAEKSAAAFLDRAIEGRIKQLLSPCPKPYELEFNSDYEIHWLAERVEVRGEVEAYFYGSVALSPYLLDTLLGQIVQQSSEFKICVENWRSREFVLQKSVWNAL
jgi:hypothetical protein